MRKLLLSLIAAVGAAVGMAMIGTAPASAGGAATSLARPDVSAGTTSADLVHWRRHNRWGGLYFGFGAPYYGWGYYPRYRYYDDGYYYRPRYYYYGGGWRHHRLHRHRHHRHHWR